MRLIVIFFGVIILFTLQTFSQDTSCGIIWSSPVKLSPDSTSSYTPRIVTQGDTVHLVFESGGLKLPYTRSINGGLNWEPIRSIVTDTTRFPRPNINNIFIAINGSKLYIFFIGGIDGSGDSPIFIIVSTDRGESWTEPQSITQSNAFMRSVTIKGDTIALLATIFSMKSERVIFSTDGGASWSVSSDSLTVYEPQIALTNNWLHLVHYQYIDGYSIELVYKRSSDFGMTWQDSTVLSTLDNSGVGTSSIAASKEGNIYVIWTDYKYGCNMVGCSILFRKSTDNGASWSNEQMLTNKPWGEWSKVTVKDSILMTTWMGGSGNEFHTEGRLSYDLGKTWCPLVDVSSSQSSYSVYPTNSIAEHSVITAWEQRDTVGDFFYIMARVGMLLRVSVNENNSTLPTHYEILPAYPNPFNSTTRIRYSIPQREHVKMTIHNLLGQELETIVDSYQLQGWHEAVWQADKNPSGLYFYRLSTKNYFSIGKILLIK
jgi:hypothetical protein